MSSCAPDARRRSWANTTSRRGNWTRSHTTGRCWPPWRWDSRRHPGQRRTAPRLPPAATRRSAGLQSRHGSMGFRGAAGSPGGRAAAGRRLEPLVARNLVPAGRDTARHEKRRLRDRAGHVRVAADRAAPRSRSDRGRCRLARPEPGPRRVMACLVAQPEPRSGVGPRPLHARRRNRLRRAGSDGGRQARVACARQGGFSRRRVGASSPESSSSSTACSSRNPGFRAFPLPKWWECGKLSQLLY